MVVARLPGLGRHRAGLAACVMLSVLAVMAVLAPWIAPRDPLAQNRADRFLPPSLTYPFGSDEFGRDILSRVIHGARISLLTGVVAVLIGGTVGVPRGLLGGFAGGLADAAIMRVLDFLLAVPAILLAMVIIAILGPGSFNAMLAVGVVSVPSFARLTRASTLTLKEREFVVATRALGVGPAYLMVRTILLNALTPIVVHVAVTAALAMLLEAALSFLDLGTQPPAPSWGSMLNTGRSFLYHAPWYGLFPGMVITLSVLSLNALADALQVVVDRGGAGRPVPVAGRVRLLSDGRFTSSDKKSAGVESQMGRAAVVEIGRIAVLATERPAFTVDPAFYRSVGLEPRDAKIVVVKSPLQFRDGYGAIARACWVVDTPGPSTARLERLDWRHRSQPLFPFDDDFEPEIRAVLGPGRGGDEDRR